MAEDRARTSKAASVPRAVLNLGGVGEVPHSERGSAGQAGVGRSDERCDRTTQGGKGMKACCHHFSAIFSTR